MATRKRPQRSMPHLLEVQREAYALVDARRRLLAIEAGLRISEDTSTPYLGGLSVVLRASLVAEAAGLYEMADRLWGLLGSAAPKLNGGA